MTQTQELDLLVTSVAASIGLTIDPLHRPGVVLNLGRLLAEARHVMAVALPMDTEPAPAFIP